MGTFDTIARKFFEKNGACGGLKKYNVQYNIQIWKIKSKYKYNIVSIVDMIRFHYQFRKLCFFYCGFHNILTKITSLGDVVFLDFQIGRFEGGGNFLKPFRYFL